jgi:glutamate N-acetyltransferase/amino-acid N-acetyltransferase
VRGGQAQAVMINSGNANAGTGDKGLKFAEWSCRELASRLSIDPRLVVPCSTGVIGVQLDRDSVRTRRSRSAWTAQQERRFSAAARARS